MLARWNDFGRLSAFDQIRREMDRMWADHGSSGQERSWLPTGPRIEIFDEDDTLVVRAEVPGFAQDDLEITVDRGVLVLKGKREDKVPDGYAVRRKERGAMSFTRAFTLPTRVKGQEAEARLDKGVLEIRIPHAEEAKPQKIEVREA